jgi:hypothetical protein
MKKFLAIKIIINIINLIRLPIKKYRFSLRFKNRFTVHYEKTPNSLSELCGKYGSDKGSINSGDKPFTWKPHNYTDYYEHLFAFKRDLVTTVFECGIGTNNVNLASNMTARGNPGASLRVWRDYFTNATIYGADIDKGILFQESRIKTDYIDQLNPVSIHDYWTKLANIKFDIMIDDGLHTFEAATTLFENSVQNLDKNGVYVIEDINSNDLSKFSQYFDQTVFKVEYVTFKSPEHKFGDTSIISIRR